MPWAASIYVDEHGTVYGAAKTDQRFRLSTHDRTVNGEPVEHAGLLYGSQMTYKPYLKACQEAAELAAKRKTILDHIVEALD